MCLVGDYYTLDKTQSQQHQEHDFAGTNKPQHVSTLRFSPLFSS
jgi:hypothetical protein